MSTRRISRKNRVNKGATWLARALEVGSEAAEVLVHMSAGITPLNAVAVSMRIANSVRSYTTTSSWDYLSQNGWRELSLGGYEVALYRHCVLAGASEWVSGIDEGESLLLTRVHDIQFLWMTQSDAPDAKPEGPWIGETTDPAAARSALGRAVWEGLGVSCARIAMDSEGNAPIFEADTDEKIYPSSLGDGMAERARLFFERERNRSVLLVGTPGTGKSCLMRYVAEQIGGYSLRVPVGELTRAHSRLIMAAVDLLRPKTLLVDDFDRVSDAGKLLTELERIGDKVPLFMATANDLKRLPEAAFRPGRFDEWRQIKKLDDKIIDKMIGDDVPAKYRKVLAEMPIAYIFEFHERADAIGRETAISEIHELAARTKLLHKLHRSETRDTFRRSRTTLARAKRAERQAESAEKAAERYRKTADRLEKAAPLLATQAKRLHEQADKQAKKKAVRKAKKKTRKGTKRRAKKRPKGNAEPASSLTEEEALNMSDMAVELASADDDDEPSHVYGVDPDDLEGQNDPEE